MRWQKDYSIYILKNLMKGWKEYKSCGKYKRFRYMYNMNLRDNQKRARM